MLDKMVGKGTLEVVGAFYDLDTEKGVSSITIFMLVWSLLSR